MWKIKARRRLSAILEEIIKLRKDQKRSLVENDLLGSLLNYKSANGDEVLSDEQIADNIIGVLFAAKDTTASVMTWTIKFLHDNPKVLEAVKVYKIKCKTAYCWFICLHWLLMFCDLVKAEQNALLKINNGGPLTWSQTREMPLSYKV